MAPPSPSLTKRLRPLGKCEYVCVCVWGGGECRGGGGGGKIVTMHIHPFTSVLISGLYLCAVGTKKSDVLNSEVSIFHEVLIRGATYTHTHMHRRGPICTHACMQTHSRPTITIYSIYYDRHTGLQITVYMSGFTTLWIYPTTLQTTHQAYNNRVQVCDLPLVCINPTTL